MSEQINKVLASTAQAFTTAEQKQARDNIAAAAASALSNYATTAQLAQETADRYSGDTALQSAVNSKLDSSASSQFYLTSNPSGFITGYDTSNCLSAVNHDSNLSGSGTNSVPLGLNSSIVFTSSNRQNTIQSDKMELTGKTNPLVFSGTYRPWGWDISGSATSTTGVTNPKTAIVQSTSYFSMYNTSDDNEKAQGYFTFRGAGFGESGTGGAGDERHTNISIEGITSISGYMGTASSHTGFYLTNGADANHDLELKFESGSTTAKVDIDSINRWNSYSAATRVASRSYPYTDAVAYTNLTIFDPGSIFGSVISDQNSNNIGYLVPKYNAPTDLGKVLTVVSDDGYRCEWQDPTGGIPQITPMGSVTYYASGDDYIDLEDNVAYFIETNAGGSFTIHLGTLSRQTIHSKIYLVGTQANCVTMTVVYEDEAGQVCQLNFVYGDSQSDTYYGLDVYARLVTIGGGRSISFDTTMCRVYDYPCQNRDYFSSDNNNIGLVVDYMEPL